MPAARAASLQAAGSTATLVAYNSCHSGKSIQHRWSDVALWGSVDAAWGAIVEMDSLLTV